MVGSDRVRCCRLQHTDSVANLVAIDWKLSAVTTIGPVTPPSVLNVVDGGVHNPDGATDAIGVMPAITSPPPSVNA
jgi:hypothetical protein